MVTLFFEVFFNTNEYVLRINFLPSEEPVGQFPVFRHNQRKSNNAVA
jgi:hypothetical protein